MVKRREAAPEFRTIYSSADEYLDDRRKGQLWRVQVKFPLIEDRRAAGNIDYTNELNRRSWREKVPEVGRPNDQKSIKGAYELDDSQFIYVNDAPNGLNIPRFNIATSSGHEPLVDPPLTVGEQQGYPTDNPVEINADFENNVTSGEFFIGMNIETENMRGYKYPYRFYNSNPAYKDIRFDWQIKPEFDNPMEPNVRYPRRGARRNKKSTI